MVIPHRPLGHAREAGLRRGYKAPFDVAPGKSTAVALGRERVVGSSGDHRDTRERCDRDGGAPVRGGVITELTVQVVTPGRERPRARAGKAVVHSRGDGGGA